ncbi:MAG: hypothetical protein Q8920_01765 [Bacillota bacterium]|nr:hypothetical protein [Bacillota bacterium]
MFSIDNISSLFREVVAQLGSHGSNQSGKGNNNSDASTQSNTITGTGPISAGPGIITPAQALVIAGLLGGVFEVTSVLIDKNQVVEILLSGSLKKKTTLDKMLDQIGNMRFDDVLRAIVDRLG